MGDSNMIFEKVDRLFKYYLYKEVSKEEILEFRKQYEVIFENFRDELEVEIGTVNYEILDSIYMIFDSYEPDEKIRADDEHCINEANLLKNVKTSYESIKIQ